MEEVLHVALSLEIVTIAPFLLLRPTMIPIDQDSQSHLSSINMYITAPVGRRA